MSIPKILHTSFFGDWPMTPLNRRCQESWSRVLPDYHRFHWTREHRPQSAWLDRALAVRPINAVSWIRYWCLFEHGGVAVDNDIEVLRPFHLDYGAFIGFQRSDTDYMCTNYSVLAAEKGHPFVKRLLDEMEMLSPDDHPLAGCCILTDRVLREFGLTGLNVEQDLRDGVHVYTKEAFYPFFHTEAHDRSRATEKTFTIHWSEGSWLDGFDPKKQP